MSENRNLIIVLRGCAGCGKSTYAARLLQSLDAMVISSDNIRRELNDGLYEYSDQQNKLVFKILEERIERYSKIANVIIDATNLMTEKELVSKYEKYGTVIVIDVNKDVSLYECVKRTRKRKSHKIPIGEVIKMYHSWKNLIKEGN